MNLGKKTVLVIGGEGYIGTVLCAYLLQNDYFVRSFDSLIYGNRQAAIHHAARESDYQFINGDMTDKDALKRSLVGVDVVILLAGLVGDPITKKYPREAEEINQQGVVNTIDTVIEMQIDRLVFVSTCSNYGVMAANELADEEYPTNPQSSYADAKIASELHLLSRAKDSVTIPTVLRFATAFGLSPRMRFDLTVSEFVAQLYLGNELYVYDAHTWRPYCHVLDFAKLIEIVIRAPSKEIAFEIFNAGGDTNNCTKQMIVELILKKIPHGKVKYKLDGVDPRNYRVNFTKVKDRLNFEPKYMVGYGIDELIGVLEEGLFPTPTHKIPENGNYLLPGRDV